MKDTYRIPTCNRGKLSERISQINRKAAKLSLAPVTLEWGEPYFLRTEEEGRWIEREYSDATVEGETPRINGWAFIATLEHFADPDNQGAYITVVRAVPGVSVPERFRTIGPLCEHCNEKRKRNQTYILVNGNASKAVGSTCLRDFTGAGFDPDSAASFCEMMGSIRELAESLADGNRAEKLVDLGDFLSTTAAFIRLEGWWSRAACQGGDRTATATMVSDWFFRQIKTEEDKVWFNAHLPTDADKAVGAGALAWATALGTSNKALSDYEYNVLQVVRIGRVEWRLMGIAASIVACYQRAVGQDILRAKARAESNHFGTVGERITRDLTLVRVFETEGKYGVTYICKFVDSDGNHAVWFSSKPVKIQQGDTANVKGTVKAHNEYQGIKETVLTRCAVSKGWQTDRSNA